MFAKSSTFAVASITLALATGAFAQATERDVFDTETALRLPAAASASGLTREAVQAAYIAERAAQGIGSFNPDRWYVAQNSDSAPVLVALVPSRRDQALQVSAGGLTRDQVRAELLAARANGELNPFDTETDLRVAPSAALSAPMPAAMAQR